MSLNGKGKTRQDITALQAFKAEKADAGRIRRAKEAERRVPSWVCKKFNSAA